MKKIIIIVLLVLAAAGAVVLIGSDTASYDEYADTDRNLLGDDEVYVYETPVDSADECSSLEQYDADAGVCYFECVDPAECADIESEIDAELSEMADQYTESNYSHDETTPDDIDSDIVADYRVQSGERLAFITGTNNAVANDIWRDISALSPDSLSDTYIESFQVFDNPDDDTLAFVDDEDGNGKWRIAVNLSGHNDSTPREQQATFIHELSHILTLNESQVRPSKTCTTYETAEGCAGPTSYLYQFVQKFWPESEQDYTKSKFVTEYAATNSEEDLAESFTFFVLDKQPTGFSIVDQKLTFFYSYPELLELRQSMRNVLARDIVRARMNR